MGRQNTFLAFMTGVAVGAVAVFLSDAKNRQAAMIQVDQASRRARSWGKSTIEEAQQASVQAKQLAQEAMHRADVAVKAVQNPPTRKAATTSTKRKSSKKSSAKRS